MRIYKYLIVVGFISGSAVAHEESCVFEARLSKIATNTGRDPQTNLSSLTANVDISTAKPQKGQLSYLDCKHWENESIQSAEIQVPDVLRESISNEQLVTLEYKKSDTSDGIKTSWKLLK